mgnify:CR=1 FL=1
MSLQVSAADKASGKSQKITITSDKGRLSEEEIQQMVQDAEENAENDKIFKAKVEGRNKLESYLYNVKSTTSEQAFQAKLSAEEKTLLSEAVSDGLEWLELAGGEGEDMEQHTVEELEEKLQEVEAIVSPIMSRVYQASGAPAGAASGDATADEDGDSDSEPTVEEA